MTEEVQRSVKILARLIATAIHDKYLDHAKRKNLGQDSDDSCLPASTGVLVCADLGNVIT